MATLNARFCETANKAGRFGDGRGGFGLALNVKRMSNGRLSKSWTQRLRIAGKPTNLGLGRFDFVTLAEARAIAKDNAKLVAKGIDPRGAGIPTFAEAVDAVVTLDAPNWKGGIDGKSAQQWRASLRDHLPAAIHDKRIDKIEHAELFAPLSQIWYDKPTTAKRIRQRLGRIFAWAISNQHRADNPASSELMAGLRKAKTKKQHFAALPFNKVADALTAIRDSKAERAVKLAFELLILTAARSGEIRGATWSEIDLEAATWTIPGARMKASEAHTQPLSARAVEVLLEARELSNGDSLVFTRESGRKIGNDIFPKLCKTLGLETTTHGFRTSWRVWATERTSIGEAAIESQLAHKIANEARAAYDRSDRLEARREAMARWSAYVNRTSGDVVQIGRVA